MLWENLISLQFWTDCNIYIGYFQVINTESDLKNINKKDGCLNINIEGNNKYQNNKYSTESCCNSQTIVNNPFDNQMFNKNTKAKCRK